MAFYEHIYVDKSENFYKAIFPEIYNWPRLAKKQKPKTKQRYKKPKQPGNYHIYYKRLICDERLLHKENF